jgi:two-component system chemotaxis response regulator CheY
MPDYSTIKILVVDDADSVRNILKLILKQSGFESFLEDSNGEEALKLLQSAAVDIVIADWQMPKLNGLELLENVRSDDSLMSLPFIMVTGDSDKSHVLKALQGGVSDYVLKPVDAAVLQLKVIRLVENMEEYSSGAG